METLAIWLLLLTPFILMVVLGIIDEVAAERVRRKDRR